MTDLRTLDAEIACKHRWQRFLAKSSRDLIREVIWDIRRINFEAGLSEDKSEGNDYGVVDPYRNISRAIEIDPKNARRFARVSVANYLSRGRCERKRLENEGITEETEAEEIAKWETRKRQLKAIGYWNALSADPKPDHFYYARDYENRASELKRKYNF